jgi:hypothetical protein
MSDLDELLACGHRKVDALDSYGECIFCKFKARAADYDRLPLDVIGCHDRIEELERELAKARKHVSELCKWLNAQGTPPE